VGERGQVVHGVGRGVDDGAAEPVRVADVKPRVGDVHIVTGLPEVVLEPGPDETLASCDERSHAGSR